MFSDTFAGIAPGLACPAFIVAQLVGGVLVATVVVRILYPHTSPVVTAEVVVPQDGSQPLERSVA